MPTILRLSIHSNAKMAAASACEAAFSHAPLSSASSIPHVSSLSLVASSVRRGSSQAARSRGNDRAAAGPSAPRERAPTFLHPSRRKRSGKRSVVVAAAPDFVLVLHARLPRSGESGWSVPAVFQPGCSGA